MLPKMFLPKLETLPFGENGRISFFLHPTCSTYFKLTTYLSPDRSLKLFNVDKIVVENKPYYCYLLLACTNL